jgi:hypothetical protein
MSANLPARNEPPVPVPANVVYAYPISPPPPASIADATRVVQHVLDIVARFGDELQDAVRQPYPCVVCAVDTSRWSDWQRRRHFASHPLAARADKVGWFRAVMGS